MMSKITKRLRQSLSSMTETSLLKELYEAALSRGDGVHATIVASIRRLSLSGDQLARRVDCAAAGIGASFGVTDRYIGIAADAELDRIVLLWAVLKSGNKPFLMEPVRSDGENDAALTALDAAGVVSCGGAVRTAHPLLAWETLPTEGEGGEGLSGFGTELALFGADGAVCVLDGKSLADRLSRFCEQPDPAKKDPYSWLIALPLTTGSGLALYLLTTLSGAVAAFSADPSAEGVMRTARTLRVTHLAATPGVWHGVDRQLCRLLDSKDEKIRHKFYRSLEGKGSAPSFRALSSHLLGESLRGCVCPEGIVRDAAWRRLSAVGYAVRHGDACDAETAERLLDLPQAEEWVFLSGNTDEDDCLVIQIPSGLLRLQRQNLQDAVNAGCARLPESMARVSVWYTTEPLADAPDRSVDRASVRDKIASGAIRLLRLSDLEQETEAGEESEIKTILRSMFADILGVEETEISDDGHFMIDLGGSSLDYFTLVGEINERFGINLGFEGEEFHYTLNDFERAVKDLVK